MYNVATGKSKANMYAIYMKDIYDVTFLNLTKLQIIVESQFLNECLKFCYHVWYLCILIENPTSLHIKLFSVVMSWDW